MATRLRHTPFNSQTIRSVAASRRVFLPAALISMGVLVVCSLAPVSVQIATVGIIAAVIVSLLLAREERERALAAEPNLREQSLLIAKDDDALEQHRLLTGALVHIVEHSDPLFRSLALQRMKRLAVDADSFAASTIAFEDTETWRLAYEQLLRSPGLHLYRSVAVVHSPAYWQDEPGRRSMRLNYELQESGALSVERTVVIADELWPSNEDLPKSSLLQWIDDQHNHGIKLQLLRLSAIINEPDLQADFGIYGTRAVGVQELGLRSRTARFILSFDFDRVREAEARWDRLTVYATSYSDLLDPQEFECSRTPNRELAGPRPHAGYVYTRTVHGRCVRSQWINTERLVATSLYLDTARLGQMSRGARLALTDFIRLAGEEAGSLYFDEFLRNGAAAWPLTMQQRYRQLAGWNGIAHLKHELKRLAGARESSRLLLANRTSQLMRFAARLFFGPCRNVLVTDLSWPSYARILQRRAARSATTLTLVPLRTAILRDGLTASEVIDRLAASFEANRCDGLFLPAVDNLGIRLPIERLVGEIRRRAKLRFVVIDGAQEFCHVPVNLAAGFCDLYIAGCHKWLRAYHPMGLAFFGQPRSQRAIEQALSRLMSNGRIDDPLLAFSEDLENGSTVPFGETVNVVSLFSCHGALGDALGAASDAGTCFEARLANAEEIDALAEDAGWTALRPQAGLRSGIVLLQSQDSGLCEMPPDALRRRLLRFGIAATTYSRGRVRLAMPDRRWQPSELALLEFALRSGNGRGRGEKSPEGEQYVDRLPGWATA